MGRVLDLRGRRLRDVGDVSSGRGRKCRTRRVAAGRDSRRGSRGIHRRRGSRSDRRRVRPGSDRGRRTRRIRIGRRRRGWRRWWGGFDGRPGPELRRGRGSERGLGSGCGLGPGLDPRSRRRHRRRSNNRTLDRRRGSVGRRGFDRPGRGLPRGRLRVVGTKTASPERQKAHGQEQADREDPGVCSTSSIQQSSLGRESCPGRGRPCGIRHRRIYSPGRYRVRGTGVRWTRTPRRPPGGGQRCMQVGTKCGRRRFTNDPEALHPEVPGRAVLARFRDHHLPADHGHAARPPRLAHQQRDPGLDRPQALRSRPRLDGGSLHPLRGPGGRPHDLRAPQPGQRDHRPAGERHPPRADHPAHPGVVGDCGRGPGPLQQLRPAGHELRLRRAHAGDFSPAPHGGDQGGGLGGRFPRLRPLDRPAGRPNRPDARHPRARRPRQSRLATHHHGPLRHPPVPPRGGAPYP